MTLIEFKDIMSKVPLGYWDYDYGVSMRSAWSLEVGGQPALCLDGGSNVELDVSTGRVEPTMNAIVAALTMAPKFLGLADAVKGAMNEIGIPQPGYPMSVANAYDILAAALQELET